MRPCGIVVTRVDRNRLAVHGRIHHPERAKGVFLLLSVWAISEGKS